jgi:hypothetical protein
VCRDKRLLDAASKDVLDWGAVAARWGPEVGLCFGSYWDPGKTPRSISASSTYL